MNTNHLQGMKCPKCGSEGPFHIEISQIVILHDDGTEDPYSDSHWGDNSYCYCPSCDFDDDVHEFKVSHT